MKMTGTEKKLTIEVLEALAGKKMDTEAYKAARTKVDKFLNIVDGKPAGGLNKDTYAAITEKNGEGKTVAIKGFEKLLEAANASKAFSKELAAKKAAKAKEGPAKPAAKKAAKAAPAKADKAAPERTDAQRAADYVKYVGAIENKENPKKGAKLPNPEFQRVRKATMSYRDPANGGLKKEAYDRFKGFPGVKEAAETARKIFAKGKEMA
jgi:hypothetical protein